MHFGDRHIRALQRRLHAKLAVDRMGGFEQHAGRLAAQHIIGLGGLEAEGRVGLPDVEFLGLDRAFKALHIGRKPFGHGLGVEFGGVAFRHDRPSFLAIGEH